MPNVRCLHGIDSRFCAVCNRQANARSSGAATGPINRVSVDEIVQFLNDERVRATYGAVAEVLGVRPQMIGTLLGTRRPEASWVVNGANGLPTDYSEDLWHPALLNQPEVISTANALNLRMSVWRGARKTV